jgi:hypothetical protein
LKSFTPTKLPQRLFTFFSWISAIDHPVGCVVAYDCKKVRQDFRDLASLFAYAFKMDAPAENTSPRAAARHGKTGK